MVSYKEGFLVTELRGPIKYIPDLEKDSSIVVGVIPSVRDTMDSGVFGLAVHPEFPDSNYIYAHYSYDTTFFELRLSRFEICNDTLVFNSEKIILAHDNLASIHQGGNPIFGSGDFLYVSKGDGEGNDAPKFNGQNTMNIHGTILRMDVNEDDFPTDPRKNYKVPADNPFVDSLLILDEIYAFGVRSPWRLTIDKETGDLYLGDVGWNDYEEINLIKPGNYGWGCTEGPLHHPQFPCNEDSNLTPISPIFSGKHEAFRSITGGYVYRGTQYPNWTGNYFFADFKNGKLCIISDDDTSCWDSSNSNTIHGNFVSFGEDHLHELYLADLTRGIIHKIDTTHVDCAEIVDTLHISDIEQAGYHATDLIVVDAELVNEINFRTLEYEILPMPMITNSNFYISSDVCADLQNGVRY